MKQMIHLRRVAMCLALLMLGVVGGCGRSADERLADLAQQTMTEQVRQNDRMADQSQAVVEESHQLAETAKALVEHDAEARRELIAAQQELTSQLNGQQSAIFTGHEQLEQDRREIAEQRHRDPIVAAVIQDFGLAIACLLPLLDTVFGKIVSDSRRSVKTLNGFDMHDRDTKFTKVFTTALAGRGVRTNPPPVTSPNLNGRCGRFIQTIKLECLGKFIVFGMRHLDHLVTEFTEYYSTTRSSMVRGHLPPIRGEPDEVQALKVDEIEVKEYVGWLVKSFERKAA
jgi:hypothetical protein